MTKLEDDNEEGSAGRSSKNNFVFRHQNRTRTPFSGPPFLKWNRQSADPRNGPSSVEENDIAFFVVFAEEPLLVGVEREKASFDKHMKVSTVKLESSVT